MSITPVALAAANVRRWNLQSLGGRLMDVVRTVLTTCLRPWTAKIQESLKRTKRTMFVIQDEAKFARNCRDRVSTHLHALRMMLNDADASRNKASSSDNNNYSSSSVIPEDILLLARDVVFQCMNFVESCDELIALSEKISNSAGNPSAIRHAVNQNTSENFYTLAINENVSKSRQSIMFGNNNCANDSSSPSKFAETSRPTTRRATTPTIAMRNNQTLARIPDFHNNHIPVEIVIFNKKNTNDTSNFIKRTSTPPSSSKVRNSVPEGSSPFQHHDGSISSLPRARDLSKYYSSQNDDHYHQHSPDGISPIAKRRQEQKMEYEKYRQERATFYQDNGYEKKRFEDDDDYPQESNNERTDDELGPVSQSPSSVLPNRQKQTTTNNNDDLSPSTTSRALNFNKAHQDYSMRIIEKEKSRMDERIHQIAARRNVNKIQNHAVVCRAADPRIGQHLIEPDRLSPRQRSTIETAVNSMIHSHAELSDEDRLWLVASLRRLKIDDELSNPY